MIKLKKTLMGYKDDINGDLIAISEKEYNNLLLELKNKEINTSQLLSDNNKYKKLAFELNDKLNKLVLEKNEIDNILSLTVDGSAELNKRVEELEELNDRLFKINKELRNSKKNLTPKKEHTGYMLKRISQSYYYYGKIKFNYFSYKFETPYSSFLKISVVEKKVRDDFNGKLLDDLNLKNSLVVYSLEELKEFKKNELLDINSKDRYIGNKINEFILNILSSDEDLLIDFKLSSSNGEFWDIEFFSKKELDLNLSLYKAR